MFDVFFSYKVRARAWGRAATRVREGAAEGGRVLIEVGRGLFFGQITQNKGKNKKEREAAECGAFWGLRHTNYTNKGPKSIKLVSFIK